MALVHVLDEKTINKIAAGEVVERPASVIKELVENSIDAGATSIEIEIAQGGTQYMRIADDGCGMEEEDARLAVLRHATSKIRQVEDLFDIASLGFRGEALASISAVSHFTLTTRTAKNDLGVRITIEGGITKDCIPYGCAPGTTIEVHDLFYNTPARKKFLKTERTETSRIQDMVGKLALSNPQIAFKLTCDERVSIVTPGNGSLEDAVGALYGFKVAKDVFPVAYEAEGIFIDGLVSKPSLLKSSRTWQTFIVNNRVVSDKVIMKALDNAYHALLPKGGYPLAILRIVVPPEQIDINVHPRKNEVKFANDQALYSAIYRSVINALERPSLDFPGEQGTAIATDVRHEDTFSRTRKPYEVMRQETQSLVDSIRGDNYRPPLTPRYEQESLKLPLQEEEKGCTYGQGRRSFPEGYGSEQSPFEPPTEETNEELLKRFRGAYEERLTIRQSPSHGLIPMGQVAACYILAKKGDDLYIIDQHAAHERVRYDTLCKSTEAIPTQELLVPIFLQATDEELTYVEEKGHILVDLGYAIDFAGPTEIKITAMPLDFEQSKGEEVLRFIFSIFADGAMPTRAQLRHEMLAYASCRGAIKAGHTLNDIQMAVLIDDLFSTDKPYVCPHGRPTIVRFTPEELGKLFLRA